MIELNGSSLSIDELIAISSKHEKLSISENAAKQVEKSHASLERMAATDKLIYGVNTGFGVFANKRISRKESVKLNRNLIYSHAVATGDPLPEEIVRVAMVVRINALSKGASGVQFKIIQTLVDMLNLGVTPYISSKGSLGSSGDLCLLAQLGLVIIGDENRKDNDSGKAYYKGKLLSGKEAMELAHVKTVVFSHKDGLALINGATFSAAIAALSIYAAKELVDLADETAALSVEAVCGCSGAYHPGIHNLRNMTGQKRSAKVIRELITNSTFIDSGEYLQDAYSLRCAPQVHGAVRDTISFAEQIITAEINAATDNPLLVNEQTSISGGNFHGEPVGLISDYLSIAVTELGAISERRTFRLMDSSLNRGLPAMLVDSKSDEGLNSGVMILQYTAAALALENQTLASPDSIKSLPTSANQEDHNANAFNAAINLYKIIENTTKIIAIEMYCASRAAQLRQKMNPKLHLGNGTSRVFNIMQTNFPHRGDDAQWRKDLERLYDYLLTGSDFKKELLSIVN